MKLLKKLLVLAMTVSMTAGCASGQKDFSILKQNYKQIVTIGIIENGIESAYIEPGQFPDFCYSMNNIQTLYKLSEDSIPDEWTELIIRTRNNEYSMALASPNIRIGDTWFVVDEDTQVFVDYMQEIALTKRVKQ